MAHWVTFSSIARTAMDELDRDARLAVLETMYAVSDDPYGAGTLPLYPGADNERVCHVPPATVVFFEVRTAPIPVLAVLDVLAAAPRKTAAVGGPGGQ